MKIKKISLESGRPQDAWTPIWLKACFHVMIKMGLLLTDQFGGYIFLCLE